MAKTIYVFDLDQIQRVNSVRFVRRLVPDAAFTVVETATRGDLLASISNGRNALALVDIKSTDLDLEGYGLELIRTIQTHEQLRGRCHPVAWTQFASVALARAAAAAGAIATIDHFRYSLSEDNETELAAIIERLATAPYGDAPPPPVPVVRYPPLTPAEDADEYRQVQAAYARQGRRQTSVHSVAMERGRRVMYALGFSPAQIAREHGTQKSTIEKWKEKIAAELDMKSRFDDGIARTLLEQDVGLPFDPLTIRWARRLSAAGVETLAARPEVLAEAYLNADEAFVLRQFLDTFRTSPKRNQATTPKPGRPADTSPDEFRLVETAADRASRPRQEFALVLNRAVTKLEHARTDIERRSGDRQRR